MKISRDIVAGLAVAAVGLIFLLAAQRLRTGTMMNMGPGYFPKAVAIGTIAIGALIVLEGVRNAIPLHRPALRPMLAILAGVALFAILLPQVGLIPAMAGGVIACAAGDRTSRPWQVLALAAGAAVGAWLLFRVGLGLQLPGLRFPAWLG
jgi:hypothetical protein